MRHCIPGTQVPDDPELDDHVVDQLLRLSFAERALAQVAFEIDVEKSETRPTDIGAPFCCLRAAR